MNSNLFIKKITLERDKIDNFDNYPFNIEVIKNLREINFRKQVTFLVGENGIGKSTLIEAIAVSLGLNPEGGTQNFNFKTKDTHSLLSEYLIISKFNTPKTKFFLRAESFYNFSTELERLVKENDYKVLLNSYGGYLHNCSHGESFLQLVKNRFSDKGLYILDEPEAALSPQRQMSLLVLIDNELLFRETLVTWIVDLETVTVHVAVLAPLTVLTVIVALPSPTAVTFPPSVRPTIP